ncbi:hypothetical protein Pelo_7614 [Pelomyxa schiedti]|nr:hypothetical protein Pelo_7614 [Pelomyxa schiedti]
MTVGRGGAVWVLLLLWCACVAGDTLYGMRCSQGLSVVSVEDGTTKVVGQPIDGYGDAPGRGSLDTARGLFYELVDGYDGQLYLLSTDVTTAESEIVCSVPLSNTNLGSDTLDVDITTGDVYIMGHQLNETFPYQPRQMYRVVPSLKQSTFIAEMPFNTDLWEASHAFDPINRIDYVSADMDLTKITWGIAVDTGKVIFNSTTVMSVMTYDQSSKFIYGILLTADWVQTLMKFTGNSWTQIGSGVGGYRDPFPTATIDYSKSIFYFYAIKGYDSTYTLLGISLSTGSLVSSVTACTTGWTGGCPYQLGFLA